MSLTRPIATLQRYRSLMPSGPLAVGLCTGALTLLSAGCQNGGQETLADIQTGQPAQREQLLVDAMASPARMQPQAKMMAMPAPQPLPQPSRDRFEAVEENTVKQASVDPVSTFSIDVDTASYSFSRRMINEGRLPTPDAVRLEEWVNYFDYDYTAPASPDTPFSTGVTVVESPWTAGNKLVHIGIKGYQVDASSRPRANLVFLLDVSGSMGAPDKLPLLQQSLSMMVKDMHPEDSVAIVVYAGASGVVLPPTAVKDRTAITQALSRLKAGGSTAGGEGIQLAYQLAEQHFDEKAINRVILATDGDFNVGVTDPRSLEALVSRQREKGIYLSVLGFGQGNYNDHLMQTLAQNGNGVAAYIDNLNEARKVLVTESTSSLFTIAEDVKIQVEFNPATVQEYRLLGYETRALQREDFNNDSVDAGEIGAGHTVTALYEITPVGEPPLIDASRYGKQSEAGAEGGGHDEYAFIKLRYKRPGESRSQRLQTPVPVSQRSVDGEARQEVEFAVAVAGAAQLIRGSKFSGGWTLQDAIALAQKNRGEDPYGYRSEFVQLLRQASVSRDI